MTDYHPFDPSAPAELAIANLEAEQALLGVLLFDNDAWVAVDGVVAARDFYEPFHQRMFRVIGEQIRAGRRADPILLRDFFVIDPAFQSFGGIRYFGDLMDRAPPTGTAPDYGKQIRSLALRRDVVRIAASVTDRAKHDTACSGADLMADMEREMLAVRTGKDDLGFTSWAEASRAVVYGMDRPDDRRLLQLGIRKIDDIMGGAERGDLIVLGGRPGMGKSAIAACMALKVARNGFGVAEINAEMTTAQMSRRHISDLAFELFGTPAPQYRDIRKGDLSDLHRQMVAETQHRFSDLPVMMVKRTGLTLGRIRAMLNRQKMLWEALGVKMSLVVIDHVGLVAPDEGGRSRNEDQTIVSGRLKEMAEELDVVMLALAQLNREVEKRDDKRPQLPDLRDSGSWEQDADVVIGAYRDAYYARREREPKGDLAQAEHFARMSSKIIEAIALKVREGDVGTARLWASIGHNAILDDEPMDLFDPPGARAFDFSQLPLPSAPAGDR